VVFLQQCRQASYFRPMQLSVIIVSYNVRYFLEQCLSSVKKALECTETAGGDSLIGQTEVLVVDNCSTDGSVDYLQPRFLFARFIANPENTGFARANNQALAQSRGKYILFLNPDTILPEDGLLQCFAFMESHPEAGALGARMIDGSGRYLPESKRGFPTPWVSFCKMSGLTRLFPHSRLFARYYLGHLSPAESHAVDILSGAFMWARKETLDKTGGFDERFFMYAEDIDLSYRILQAGYRNYYFADATILHFKGESTRKDARYIRLFYTAMILFVRKHFRGMIAWWYVKLLEGIIGIKSFYTKTGKTGSTTTTEPDVYLTGDELGIEEMRAIATKAGKKINVDAAANTWILCEGTHYLFKKIIQQLQENTGTRIYIHAKGTDSAVGSVDKKDQGMVITDSRIVEYNNPI